MSVVRAVLSRSLVVAALALTPAALPPPARRARSARRVTVPLDHRGATPGTLPLAYAKVPATGTRTGTIVFLSGGPGQAAIPLTTPTSPTLLRPLRVAATTSSRSTSAGRASPARSTARSTASTTSPPARPSSATGARSSTRRRPRKDLEDLRVALGVDKLTLLGVSYGAKVAGEYARRFPAAHRRAGARLARAGRRPRRLRPAAHARHPARAARGLLPGPVPRARCATRTRRWPPPPSGCSTARCAGRWSPRPGASTTARVTRGRRSTRLLAGERRQPGAARRAAGRDRVAGRRATRRRCCTCGAARSRRATAAATTSTPRACWRRRASRAGCRGRRTRRSPRARTR